MSQVNPPNSAGYHFTPQSSLQGDIDSLMQMLNKPSYSYEKDSCMDKFHQIQNQLSDQGQMAETIEDLYNIVSNPSGYEPSFIQDTFDRLRKLQ